MAASLTLLQITSVDLMHLKARLFLERAGFNVDWLAVWANFEKASSFSDG